MKWLKGYKIYKESISSLVQYNKPKKKYSKSLISEICISMILLNNEFLDNILDKGLKARYEENSNVFLTDLKSLLLAKNRLSLGSIVNNRCVEDDEMSKVNDIFNNISFDINSDWNLLVNSRVIARNIIDKLLPDSKLESDEINKIYLLNHDIDGVEEDIVIELKNGNQYSFVFKSLSKAKSASFNTFSDELIGDKLDMLFKDDYLSKWDKLTKEWVRLIYENCNKDIQKHIEKFIDPLRIDSITYFNYFDIKHRDPNFKYLGENIPPFDKNILYLSDLLSNVWKNRDIMFMDKDRVYKEWMETKIVIMNSRILENLFNNALKSNYPGDIIKMEDGYKTANGKIKIKLIKLMLSKIGALERPIYYIGKNGNEFNLIPSRSFFRENFDKLDVKFDYHVKFDVSEDEENNDFKLNINISYEKRDLMSINVIVKFSNEMSGKLVTKFKFNIADDFNYIISKIDNGTVDDILGDIESDSEKRDE